MTRDRRASQPLQNTDLDFVRPQLIKTIEAAAKAATKTDAEAPDEADFRSYNVLQRLTYLLVIFVLVPLVLWTALAMSPDSMPLCPERLTGSEDGNPPFSRLHLGQPDMGELGVGECHPRDHVHIDLRALAE